MVERIYEHYYNRVYDLLANDCSIRVYQSICCNKYVYCTIYILPIMPALCLVLAVIHYAQNYAGIIGGSLIIALHR